MQPDMIASAVHALQLLLEPARLAILFLGVLIGLAIGVLPGLGGIVGIAMLIPFTYNLDASSAFALLLGMASVIDHVRSHHRRCCSACPARSAPPRP